MIEHIVSGMPRVPVLVVSGPNHEEDGDVDSAFPVRFHMVALLESESLDAILVITMHL